MAKKIVRGITDVKTINNQDFDTNNVNDLLSDGQYNYIHRKKGKNEEYHNLTDNIKTISSDNTELLSVTNNNKTTNTATLHPKHDAQKEQVLESTRDTITINHGTNGTAEKTTVDTNPKKVLEHENLINEFGISKTQSGNITKLGLLYTPVPNEFDLNTLYNGRIRAGSFKNAPKNNTWFFVSSFVEGEYTIQEAITLIDDKNTTYRRLKNNGVWGEWREQLGDKSVIDELLSQKQDVLTPGTGITIQGNTISATGGGGVKISNIMSYGYKEKLSVIQKNFDVDFGISQTILKTFTFQFSPLTSEVVINGTLVQEIEPFIPDGTSISNGAITITNDGTSIKVTNSNSTENTYQQATFTFNILIPDAGGDVIS